MERSRMDFPFFSNNPDLIYLDNAATSQKPKCVIDELIKFYTQYNVPVHRSFYPLAEEVTRAYESVRAKTAMYFGAAFSDEIIFTSGATSAFNAIAFGLIGSILQPGDEIAISVLEHHSAFLPFFEVAQRAGIRVRYIPINLFGQIDESALDECITQQTRCVVCTAGSNVVGVENNFLPVLKRAKHVGALFVLDAAQMAPRRTFNLAQLGVDCFVCAPHKMCGPTGLGIAYVAKKHHSVCRPWMFGGSMVQRIDTKSWDSMPMPTMWEAGTSPVAEIIAFGRTLTFLETISMSLLKKHEASLTRQFVSGVAPFEHITLVGNPVTLSEEGHLVSFLVKDWHAHDVALYLAQYGIAVRSGYHCAQPLHIALNLSQTVRASWYMYTTSEDIARLIGALKNLGA